MKQPKKTFRNPYTTHAKKRKAGVMSSKKLVPVNLNDYDHYDDWDSDVDPGWYAGPLTKEHIAELRYKLAGVRGILSAFLTTDSIPTVTEVTDILEESKDS
jgi:hypothetical protein